MLSRCHDAIKILESEEKKFQGPLKLRKSSKQQTSHEKFKSPLVKSAEARISFTEIPRKPDHKSAFTTHLNNLLQGVGLLDEVVELDDDPEPIISSYLPKGTSPPPPPHISRKRQPRNEDNFARIHVDNRLSKMIQTEPLPKCADCEKRRKIVHKSEGCQTGELMTYSVSTQVTEDDFVTKIPKNQSLASLTPAQLLAQDAPSSKRYNDDNFDSYSSKSLYRGGTFDYARAAESYGSSGSLLNSRFLPPDRDRNEPSNSLLFQGPRGRGPPNNFDTGSRYNY